MFRTAVRRKSCRYAPGTPAPVHASVQAFRKSLMRWTTNAGVPERVAMTITGHKTRSVFDLYHIVSPGDLQEAARRLAGLGSGHSFGHS